MTTPRPTWIISLSIFFLPLALSPLFLSGPDLAAFLIWCLLFILFGLAGLPLTSRLFPDSPDGGWTYALLTGLLLPAFLVWTLAHFGLPLFQQPVLIVLLLVLILGLPFVLAKTRWVSSNQTPLKRQLPIRLAETGLFLAAFLFWAYLRSHRPEIYGLEKFMDYGFLMSLQRSETLPAVDMWFAGHSINYYYFGQYLFSFITKLSGVAPAIAYNLSIAASFALTFLLSFTLVRDLLLQRLKDYKIVDLSAEIAGEAAKPWKNRLNYRRVRSTVIPTVGGLLGAGLVTLGGNSHAFFYGTGRPGNFLVRFLARSGVNVGKLGDFYFSDSTRFIGYNPESVDRTIHEFPFYSYLVADLHAHMINLSIVLLLLAVLLAWAMRRNSGRPAIRDPQRPLDLGANQPIVQTPHYKPSYGNPLTNEPLSPELIVCGILLGISAMANYWDYVIYTVVSLIVLYLSHVRSARSLGKPSSYLIFLGQLALVFMPFLLVSNAYLQLLCFGIAVVASYIALRFRKAPATSTGFALATLFLISHLTALPFNSGFDPMAKTLVPTENRSGLYALFILWLFHVLVAVIYCIYFFYSKKRDGSLSEPRGASLPVRLLSQNLADTFILVLILCGLGLILAPELLYVRDIYEGSFSRANTMFKFTYQSFVLLSLTAAYTWGVLMQRMLPSMAKARVTSDQTTEQILDMPRRFQGKRSLARRDEWRLPALVGGLVVTLLLFIPFSYTPELKSWYGDLSRESAEGLAGDRYLGTIFTEDPEGGYHELAHRLALIDYLNEHIEGQPVVLEAFGDSYSDFNSLSAYTGLPTVLGWQTHEWLWRTSKNVPNAYQDIVAPLQAEIRDFYEARNPMRLQDFIREHKVEYLVIGELERIKFPGIAEETLLGLGEVIFQSGESRLVKLNPVN